MIRILLLRFWPALLPFVVYWIWMRKKNKEAVLSGEKPKGFFEGPWWIPLSWTFGFVILGFLWLGLSQEADAPYHYRPYEVHHGS